MGSPEHQHPPAARGGFALLAAFLVTATINYAFAVLMSWLLPIGQYGTLGVLQAYLLVAATAVSAGFPWALSHAIARRARQGPIPHLVGAALTFNALLGLGISLMLMAATFGGWLPLGRSDPTLLLLTAATVAVLAVGEVFAGALQGLVRLTGLGAVRAAEVVVKFSLGTLFVLLGAGVAGALFGFLLGALLAALLSGLLVRDVTLWRATGLRELGVVRVAIPFFVSMFGMSVLMNADIVGLRVFSSPILAERLTGEYHVAAILARIPLFVTLTLFAAVFPYVVRHATSIVGVDYARRAMKYMLLFVVPINVVLITLPEPVIGVFFSATFRSSAPPLAIAAVGTLLLSQAYALATLLLASGHRRLTAVVLPLTVALEFGALAWLVPSLGSLGAGMSLVVAGAAFVAMLLPRAIRTYGTVPPAKTVTAYVVALMTLAGLLRLLPHEGRLVTVVTIALSGLAYLLVLTVLRVITREDVDVAVGGLGTRWNGVASRVGGLVEWLNALSPVR